MMCPVSSRAELAAVLFDMDGTLLDSEKVWDVALEDLAAHLGGRLSAAARESMVGSSLIRSVRIVHADLGVDADIATSAAYLTARTTELFLTDLVFKPGARELLEAVRHAAVPAALVTSTHRRLTEIALDFMGRGFFAASICGDEVSAPKPAPEPYLRAAQLLGAPISACVAIEDSPLGIASARAAGCRVLAVPSDVELDATPAFVTLDSLVGVDVAYLRGLL